MQSGPRLRWEGIGLRRIASHGREANVAVQTGRAVARKSDGQHQGLQVLLGHDRPPAKVKDSKLTGHRLAQGRPVPGRSAYEPVGPSILGQGNDETGSRWAPFFTESPKQQAACRVAACRQTRNNYGSSGKCAFQRVSRSGFLA